MTQLIKSKIAISAEINRKIEKVGYDSGFSTVSVIAIDELKTLTSLPRNYTKYLNSNMVGDMTYLKKKLRYFHRPNEILPNVKSAIVVAMNYLNQSSKQDWQKAELKKLDSSDTGYISLDILS